MMLHKYKADMDKPRNDGITPLFIACEKNHSEIVQFLIQNVIILSSDF